MHLKYYTWSAKLLSKVVVPFCFSAFNVWERFYILVNTKHCHFFSHANMYIINLIWVLICISPINNELPECVCLQSMSLIRKSLFNSFLPLVDVLLLLLLWIMRVHTSLLMDINILCFIDAMFCTNWSFVTSLHQASPFVLFFQHLFLCVSVSRFGNAYNISIFSLSLYLLWWCYYCNGFGEP